MYNICIVGAGAAGMAAALSISMENQDLKIILIEKKEEVGKKLSATGNGKCNISNNILPSFGDTSKFFRKIGIEIKVDSEGRAYPVSESAKDVVKGLENAVTAWGCDIVKKEEVMSIEKEDVYIIKTNKNQYTAEKVILATGGKSAPQFGTTGDGYRIAKKLGHTINKLAPALVPVECESEILGNIAGVRAKGKVNLFRHGFFVESEEGEIQFTKDGLSGICIFNLSNYLVLNEKTSFKDYKITIDLLSRYQEMEIFHMMKTRKNILNLDTKDLMLSIVNSKIAERLLEKWSIKYPKAAMLSDEQLKEIIGEFRNVEYKVTGAKGWKDAQCTKGGISWDDFDWDTFESKVCPGLYVIGEIIDYDGPCGGFNLENAWLSARKAGKAICTEYTK